MSFLDDPPLHDFPDRAFRRYLEDPRNLRDLLADALPTVAPRLDYDHVEKVDRAFLLEDWRGRESDLLFRIPFRAGDGLGEVLICLLLEHQSQSDPRMPLRMLLYAVLYWERQWKEWEDRHAPDEPLRLTPIIPLVFHTGPRPWGSNRTLADLVAAPAELRPFLPDWSIVFWGLAQRAPADLLAAEGPFMKLLTVVRAEGADSETFQELFAQVVRQLEPLAGEDKMRWHDLLWFVVSWAIQRRPRAEREPLLQAAQASQQDLAAREEVKTVSEAVQQTWAQAIQADAEALGEARGEAKGRVEGELVALRRTLRKWLTDTFGPLPDALVQQIEECRDLDHLDAAVGRIRQVQSLDQFQL